ncbi:hypothetical protein BDC45DRAFT_537921 [Circinella umbellata]|nr:hypothetical protein BDC45DRAFT_537921 [Circinella umbellata]
MMTTNSIDVGIMVFNNAESFIFFDGGYGTPCKHDNTRHPQQSAHPIKPLAEPARLWCTRIFPTIIIDEDRNSFAPYTPTLNAALLLITFWTAILVKTINPTDNKLSNTLVFYITSCFAVWHPELQWFYLIEAHHNIYQRQRRFKIAWSFCKHLSQMVLEQIKKNLQYFSLSFKIYVTACFAESSSVKLSTVINLIEEAITPESPAVFNVDYLKRAWRRRLSMTYSTVKNKPPVESLRINTEDKHKKNNLKQYRKILNKRSSKRRL